MVSPSSVSTACWKVWALSSIDMRNSMAAMCGSSLADAGGAESGKALYRRQAKRTTASKKRTTLAGSNGSNLKKLDDWDIGRACGWGRGGKRVGHDSVTVSLGSSPPLNLFLLCYGALTIQQNSGKSGDFFFESLMNSSNALEVGLLQAAGQRRLPCRTL